MAVTETMAAGAVPPAAADLVVYAEPAEEGKAGPGHAAQQPQPGGANHADQPGGWAQANPFQYQAQAYAQGGQGGQAPLAGYQQGGHGAAGSGAQAGAGSFQQQYFVDPQTGQSVAYQMPQGFEQMVNGQQMAYQQAMYPQEDNGFGAQFMPWQQTMMPMSMAPLDGSSAGWQQQQQQHMQGQQPYYRRRGQGNQYGAASEAMSRADVLVGTDPAGWNLVPWDSIQDDIRELAFSKNGSLCLQTKLTVSVAPEGGNWKPVKAADQAVLEKIMTDLSGVLDKVMQDRYGSHLTRAIVELSTSKQRIQIWKSLKGKLVETSCTHFGKWTIQKLITAASTAKPRPNGGSKAQQQQQQQQQQKQQQQPPQQLADNIEQGKAAGDVSPTVPAATPTADAVVDAFAATAEEIATIQASLSSDDIVTLFRERDGAHVVRTYITCMLPADRQFIFDAAEAHIMRLATDKYGGATLQRCLEAGDADQRLTLAVAITKNALALVSDAHGNYILQHVLTMQALPPKQAAIAALKGSFVRLARHKFGSNVVEKCVQAGEWALAEVVSEISAARSGVEDLLSDQYGNYVVRFHLSDAFSIWSLARRSCSKPHRCCRCRALSSGASWTARRVRPNAQFRLTHNSFGSGP